MANKKKNENRGNTWCGYYTRTTKNKKDKIKSAETKHKKNYAREIY